MEPKPFASDDPTERIRAAGSADATGGGEADASLRDVAPESEITSTVDFDRTWALSREGESFAEAVSPAPLLPPREPLGARIAAIMARRHWLLLPLCVALLWGAISYRPPGESFSLRVGDIVPRDVVATHSATVLDRELTDRNRDDAAELVPPQYDVRANASSLAQSDLRAILDASRRAIQTAELARKARPQSAFAPTIRANLSKRNARNSSQPAAQQAAPLSMEAARANEPLEPMSLRVSRLNSGLARPLPEAAARQILETSPERWRVVAREAMAALRAGYEYQGRSQKIRSDVADDRLAARRRMLAVAKARVPRSGLQPDEVETAFLLASNASLAPNLIVNPNKTERARDVARDNVAQVFRSIKPGTVIVEAGTRIDAERRAELQDLDVVTPHFAWPAALARLALCIVVVCFAAGYIARVHPQLEAQPTSLWLAAMVPIAFVAIFRWALRAPHGDLSMVPLSAVSALLLTMLINERLGILAAFSVPALCALVARAEPGLFLAAALSAAVGVLCVAEIFSRSHIARAALILAGTNAVLALALGLLRDVGSQEAVFLACWGALGGGGSVLAAVGLAQLLERPFNITTHLRLLELTGANEPVMRRMQSEAPGTYTHSLMVGLLSEAAGKAVGADPLLCRVGGLYHDIGKLRRPHCFVENQSGENVHDKLSPHFSALLIVSHVRDGIELGRALRLPMPVIDIIAQHHGTSLIAYFYHRAKSTVDIDRTPDETLFRYPGPKPQSKEAAIVLLADTVEASSRALPNFTIEGLEAHIRAMLVARQADGELNECDLTMRDLATIESSFAHVLRGVLHHRIEYPDPARANDNWVQNTLAESREGEARGDHRRSELRRLDRRRRDDQTHESQNNAREARARNHNNGSANGENGTRETGSADSQSRDRTRTGGRKPRSVGKGEKNRDKPKRTKGNGESAENLSAESAHAESAHAESAHAESAHAESAHAESAHAESAHAAEQTVAGFNGNADNGNAHNGDAHNGVEPRRCALVRLGNGRIIRKGSGTADAPPLDTNASPRRSALPENGASGAHGNARS